jgi:hypothetical protein
MKKDIYAIYESYIKVDEGILPRANANHTSRFSTGRPAPQEAAFANNTPRDPVSYPVEGSETVNKISSLIKELERRAGEANYPLMLKKCEELKQAITAAHIAKK